jgi:DNA modification methylase
MAEIKPIEYWLNKIHCGDAYELLKQIPSESVDVVITSPPYYGLRTYGKYTEKIFDGDPNCSHEWNGSFCVKCNAYKGELGLEPDYRLYVKHLVDLFREVKRVLKKQALFG